MFSVCASGVGGEVSSVEEEWKVRVLHLLNMAGVSTTLAKFMPDVISRVFATVKSDPCGFTAEFEGGRLFKNNYRLAASALLAARHADIVHVHYHDELLPWLRRLYPKKVLIMHYHGDDIRDKWRVKQGRWRLADKVFYAVTLEKGAPEDAVYIPSIVDTCLFKPSETVPVAGSALHFNYFADDLAEEYALQYGLDLTVHRKEQGVIPYKDMPGVLSGFEFLVDVKRNFEGKLLPALSVTGLEMLALGRKVLDYAGHVHVGLPVMNRPENVAKKVYREYVNVLGGECVG